MHRKLFNAMLILLLAGCDADVHNHPDLVTGKQLFEYHCSGCHNDAGQGNFLKGIPANKRTELDSGQIAHKLKHGEKNSVMPVFETMDKNEADKIISYLKELKPVGG